MEVKNYSNDYHIEAVQHPSVATSWGHVENYKDNFWRNYQKGKKLINHLPFRILHIMPYFLRCTSLRRDLNKSFIIELNSWLLLHITEKPPLSQKWSFATARNDDDQPHEFHWKGSDFSNSRNFPNRRERFWPPNSIWWIFQVFLHFFTIFTWEFRSQHSDFHLKLWMILCLFD